MTMNMDSRPPKPQQVDELKERYTAVYDVGMLEEM